MSATTHRISYCRSCGARIRDGDPLDCADCRYAAE